MTISAHYHVLTTGLRWAEGPLWAERLGGLLVSDTRANTVYLLRPGSDDRRRPWTRDVFLRPAGYAGPDPPGEEHGPNGLALTLDERLVLCSPGERGVFVLDEARWTKAPLALGFEGRRFNSPNDVALHPGGALYVTDPCYGLHGGAGDPRRERSRSVYRIRPESGAVVLATNAVRDPNGIGLSPDGRTAFVSSTEDGRWHAFSVRPDGRLADGRVLLDVSGGNEKVGVVDGLAVARSGEVVATGPHGLYLFHADGRPGAHHPVDRVVSNVAFGPGDRVLFAAAGGAVVCFDVSA